MKLTSYKKSVHTHILEPAETILTDSYLNWTITKFIFLYIKNGDFLSKSPLRVRKASFGNILKFYKKKIIYKYRTQSLPNW